LHPFLPINRLSEFAVFRPQQLSSTVELLWNALIAPTMTGSPAPSHIARDELTRVLRVLEHARHVRGALPLLKRERTIS
jgi:hypothetical protein